MKKLQRLSIRLPLFIAMGIIWSFWTDTALADSLPLKRLASIRLPGPPNRFDYEAYDPKTRLLFIAHLSAGKVVVVNTDDNKVVTEIPNLRQVHGVLAASGTGTVYASATGTNEIVAINEDTFNELARIPGGVYPDGMAYVSDLHKLYVSDETGGTETVIDTLSRRRVATISLDGEAGNSQYDAASGHIFVNVQTRNELVEIDPKRDTIVGRHPLAGANGNHGLLIEPQQRLAFVACEGNARLLVVDMKTMRVIASIGVGLEPDVLAFDKELRILYVASESGVVTMFKEEGKILHKIGQGLLAPHAHSVAVNPQSHRVYFPIQNKDGHPALLVMKPT